MGTSTGERLRDEAVGIVSEGWGRTPRRMPDTPPRARPPRTGSRSRSSSRVGFVERRVGTASLVMLAALVASGVVLGLLVSTLLMLALTGLGVDPQGPGQHDGSVGAVLAGWTP